MSAAGQRREGASLEAVRLSIAVVAAQASAEALGTGSSIKNPAEEGSVSTNTADHGLLRAELWEQKVISFGQWPSLSLTVLPNVIELLDLLQSRS